MAKKQALSLEEKLEQALVKADEQPYAVPGNWVWVKLAGCIDVATDYVANGSFASLKENVKMYKSENYALMVKTQDFANDFSHSLTYTDKDGYDFLSKSKLAGGEVILSNIGSVGKVFLVPKMNRPLTLASNSIMLKCKIEADHKYLLYFFLSPEGNKGLLSITSGTTVKKFNKTDLKKVAVPLAPIKERERIINTIESLFAKLDRAKELVQTALDAFAERKAAILHQAFSGELTRKWREDIGIITEWEKKLLKEVAVFKAGHAFKSGDFGDKGYQVIRMGNLYGSMLDLSRNPVYIQKNVIDESVLKKSKINNGDILLTLTGTKYKRDYGFAVMIDEDKDLLLNQRIVALTAKMVCKEYLWYFLQTNQFRDVFFSNETGGVNQGNVSSKFVENISIPFPQDEEQQEIVRILDELLEQEAKAGEMADVLPRIEALKQTILAKAFRGELGTNDPAEESALELLQSVLQEN